LPEGTAPGFGRVAGINRLPIACLAFRSYLSGVKMTQNPLKKLGAVLCIALVMVFMQSEVASTVASVQHMGGKLSGEHHHQHMLFADIVLDFDHADHGHDAAHHDHDPGHHHRGDLGSASMVLASSGSDFVRSWQPVEPPSRGRLIVAVRQSLPERPPRAFLSRV